MRRWWSWKSRQATRHPLGTYDFSLDASWKGTAGFAYFPAPRSIATTAIAAVGGDVFLDYDYADDAHVLRHEIGHAGLQASLLAPAHAAGQFDNTDHTVRPVRAWHLAPFDLDAVAAIYGDLSTDGRGSPAGTDAGKEILTQVGDDTGRNIFGVAVRM
jgi:hypothetical protein